MDDSLSQGYRIAFARYQDAPTHDESEAREYQALTEIETVADMDHAFEHFEERDIARAFADWADDSVSREHWGDGAAVYHGESLSVIVEWDSQGFYYVNYGSREEMESDWETVKADFKSEDEEEDSESETEDNAGTDYEF